MKEKEHTMRFPYYRPRRLRSNDTVRRLIRETGVLVDDLILPLFVCPGKGTKSPIDSMPGCFQLSIDELVKEAKEVRALGIPGVLLFGIPEKKDERGSEAYAEDGIMTCSSSLMCVSVNTPVMAIVDWWRME